VQASGKGANLQSPALGLTLSVTVQIVIREGLSTERWQVTYGAAKTNDTARFIAYGP